VIETSGSKTGRAQRVVANTRRAKQRVQASLFEGIWERMLETEMVDRSVSLAGKAFTSFIPLIITVAAFLPAHLRTNILTAMADRFGLTHQANTLINQACASPDQVRRGAGPIRLVLTPFFASSFTTALERMYLRAWRRPSGGPLGPYLRRFVWLVAILT
jgi:membrane protein